MEPLWQNLIIAALVLGAAAYLIRAYLKRRQQGSCPNCQVHKLAQKRQGSSESNSPR